MISMHELELLLVQSKHSLANKTMDSLSTRHPEIIESKVKYLLFIHNIIDAIYYDMCNNSIDASLHVIHCFLNAEENPFIKTETNYIKYIIQELSFSILSVLSCENIRANLVKKFSSMKELLSDDILSELKIWSMLTKVLPLAALIVVAIGYFFTGPAIQQIFFLSVLFVIFTSMIGWWWWAISKISKLVLTVKRNTHDVKLVSRQLSAANSELAEFKNHTHDLNK